MDYAGVGITKLTIVTRAAIKISTQTIPTTIKWLSLPSEKSRLRALLFCTPKNAAATLLKVSFKLLWMTVCILMKAIMN